MFKIATWNVNSLRVRLPHLKGWLATNAPDVFALQETKVMDEEFPLEEIKAMGYDAVFSGQKTFNGVTILSQFPMTDRITALPMFEDSQKRLLAVTVCGVRVINVYVPNGSEVGSEKYEYKLRWLAAFTAFVKNELAAHDQVVILGDFNIAPADIDVYNPAGWEGSVLVSAPERAAFDRLLDLGFIDAFRAYSDEPGFSWWDYRGGRFARDQGLRIDHILFSKGLEVNFDHCRVDRVPRGLERPSDHTPVVAEFDLSVDDEDFDD